MLQQVGVVLHLGDAVQLADDALLGELHDLHAFRVEVVDRGGDGELDAFGCGALAVKTAAVSVTHLFLDVSVAGIFRETEGLDGAVFGLAPALEELERLIAEQCEAHAAAALDFGGVEVTAPGAASDCGRSFL